jgi:hypothetical protein
MNRRQLLARGLVGGVLLASAGLFVFPSRENLTAEPRFLSRRAFSVLCAVAGRIVPHADPETIAQRTDASLALAPDLVPELNQLLLLFDNALAGLLFHAHLQPFTRLSEEAQDAVIRSWRDSRVTLRRSGYQALRRLCLSAAYLTLEEQKAIAYPGPRRVPGLSFDDSKMGTAAWIAANKP